MSGRVVITAAVTGAIHTPSMSPFLPVTPEEIARDAIEAAKAGAAEVHIHARDPVDGRPSPDLQLYREIFQEIKSRVDVVICLTTGGGQGMTVEERVAVVSSLQPELASLNAGSMNFGMFPLAKKYQNWQHEWEKPFLEATRDFVFRNTFAEVEKIVTLMRQNGTKPELEVYDTGQLYNILYLMNEDLLDKPVYIQFVTGILGGIGADIENLFFLKTTADRLFGQGQYHWSVIGAGRMQFPMCVTAALLGGHCRVGLEDNLNINKNELARSSADQVMKLIGLLNQLSLQIATPMEARQLMGLKK